MRRPRHFLLSACAALLLAYGSSCGQIVLDAPIVDFRLPMFGDSGYKIWEMHGEEGHYISAERIDVIGLTIRLFNGMEDLRIETVIESPFASMFVEAKEAAGDSELRIRGGNFSIEGKNWTWRGHTQTIEVHESVEVIFYEKITDILR